MIQLLSIGVEEDDNQKSLSTSATLLACDPSNKNFSLHLKWVEGEKKKTLNKAPHFDLLFTL